MTGSAKQSMQQQASKQARKMDCFAPLAMTVDGACHTFTRHHPPPGLAFGEPDDRLRRVIQYSRGAADNREGAAYWIVRSSRTMTAWFGEAK
jgi:hypothetical protein